MREKLKALSELQKVDLDISALKKSAELFPKQIAELEKELAGHRAAVDAERARLNDIESQKRSLEQTLSDEKEKVKKWEARLAEQRSTREYAALAREIDIAKKSNQTTADELVQLGLSQTSAREAVKAKEAAYAARQDQLSGQMGDLKAKLAQADAQAKALEGQREGFSTKVDPNLLRKYEAVRKKKLPALAGVQMPGTCQGCNMNVPPQLYNTLRTTSGTDLCPSCHRIIYAAEVMDEVTSP